jgi:hypothetical protein
VRMVVMGVGVSDWSCKWPVTGDEQHVSSAIIIIADDKIGRKLKQGQEVLEVQ